MVDTSVRLPEAPSQRDDLYRICECFQSKSRARYRGKPRINVTDVFPGMRLFASDLLPRKGMGKCFSLQMRTYLYLKTEIPKWVEITIVWCGTEILHSWGDHSDHSFRVQRRVWLQADYFYNWGWRPLRWLYTLCCIKLIGKKSYFRLSLHGLEGKSGARHKGIYTVAAGMSHKP